jgi:hypothetical protein
VGAVGLAGVALSLLVDLPQGLDAGRAGLAYEGTRAELLEGFWAQLSAAATLALCGPLLVWYARAEAGEAAPASRRRTSPGGPRRPALAKLRRRIGRRKGTANELGAQP